MEFSWSGVLMPLIGTFVGAALAFGANALAHWLERRRQRRAAGNVATATLAAMMEQTLIYGRGYASALDRSRVLLPGLPDWAIVMPFVFEFSEEIGFDHTSLAFLIEENHATVFADLISLERRHRGLRAAAARLNQAVEERQRIAAQVPARAGMFVDVDDLQRTLGAELVGRIQGLHELILHYGAHDLNEYQRVATLLHGALVQCLGKRGIASFAVDESELSSIKSVRVGAVVPPKGEISARRPDPP